METEATTSEFPNGGKAIVEQDWDPRRKVNHLSKVILDRKIITEFTRLSSSTRIGKPVLMMDTKVSKDKSISRCVHQENLIYVR